MFLLLVSQYISRHFFHIRKYIGVSPKPKTKNIEISWNFHEVFIACSSIFSYRVHLCTWLAKICYMLSSINFGVFIHTFRSMISAYRSNLDDLVSTAFEENGSVEPDGSASTCYIERCSSTKILNNEIASSGDEKNVTVYQELIKTICWMSFLNFHFVWVSFFDFDFVS